jgi:hypothetical protein
MIAAFDSNNTLVPITKSPPRAGSKTGMQLSNSNIVREEDNEEDDDLQVKERMRTKSPEPTI